MRFVTLAVLVGITLVATAFAADPQPANNPAITASDSQAILPALDLSYQASNKHTVTCLSMRTYRVRKNLDRKSVIPATPDEVSFDPDSIVSYTTCQRAEKFDLRATH